MELVEARDLPAHARKEIEQFFVTAATMTGKRLTIKGWATARATEKYLAQNLA
jgi:hypothetical protein